MRNFYATLAIFSGAMMCILGAAFLIAPSTPETSKCCTIHIYGDSLYIYGDGRTNIYSGKFYADSNLIETAILNDNL